MSESTDADTPDDVETHTVPAVKYHGTGNDFVVVDADETMPDWGAFAVHHCDRETGVEGTDRTGADGVLFLDITDEGTDGADGVARATMTLVQPDASIAEMCGNGARCAAAWVHDRTGASVVDLDTPAGVRRAEVLDAGERRGHDGDDISDDDESVRVTVEMGQPSFDPVDVPLRADRDSPLVEESVEGLTVTAVDTGVPHAVAVVDDVDAVDLDAVAPPVRHAPVFPEGVNVTLATQTGADTFDQRTFERGVEGETLACGTGAVAVGAVARELGRTDHTEFAVSPPGGTLSIAVPDDGPATLTGPAEREFTVELPLVAGDGGAGGDATEDGE